MIDHVSPLTAEQQETGIHQKTETPKEGGETVLQQLQKLITARGRVIDQLSSAGAPPDSQTMSNVDQTLLAEARRITQQEAPARKTGMVAPPLDRLPLLEYGGSYEDTRKKLKEIGLQQLRQNKGSSFDESAWAAVVRKLDQSNLPQRDTLVRDFAGDLENESNQYVALRKRIAEGEKVTFATGIGDERKRYAITDESQLTPRLFVENFRTPLLHRQDIENYTDAQLAQLRAAIGVESYFQDGQRPIQVNSLKEIPHRIEDIQLGRVYKVVEKHSGDNSHEVFMKNSRRGHNSEAPVIRHVVFFKDSQHPDQILQYSEDGIASDTLGFGFVPAYFSLETRSQTSNELTISYIDHRLK